LKVTTTANNFITVPNLEFMWCHPSTIVSSVAMILKQTAFVSDLDMDFHIPEYANTDSRCPVVTKHEIQTEDCSALSTDFDNSGTLTLALTASSGLFNGKLKDVTTLVTYKLCLKVSTAVNFITVPLLEFAICSYSTIISAEEIVLR